MEPDAPIPELETDGKDAGVEIAAHDIVLDLRIQPFKHTFRHSVSVLGEKDVRVIVDCLSEFRLLTAAPVPSQSLPVSGIRLLTIAEERPADKVVVWPCQPDELRDAVEVRRLPERVLQIDDEEDMVPPTVFLKGEPFRSFESVPIRTGVSAINIFGVSEKLG